MCGIPGSGKSTLLSGEVPDNIEIVSSDAIRGELNGDEGNQDNAKQVWDTVYQRANASTKEYVIIDATFVNTKLRKTAIQRTKQSGRKIGCICIVPNLEVCLERNAKRKRVVPEEVIRNMYQSFVFPNRSEGFSEIIYFTVNGEQI